MPELVYQVVLSQLYYHLISIQVTTIHGALDGGVDGEASPGVSFVVRACIGEREAMGWRARCGEDCGEG